MAITTRVGGVYRYRGIREGYWTVYQQFNSCWFFSGSCNSDHLVGGEFQGYPGTVKGFRWEELL